MSALYTPAPCSAPPAKRTLQRLARTRLGFRALSSVVRADPQVMVEALDLHVKATAGGKSDDAAELEDLSSAHGPVMRLMEEIERDDAEWFRLRGDAGTLLHFERTDSRLS